MANDEQPLQAPIPEHIAMGYTPAGLTFTYRWFSIPYIFLAAFALLWDAFLVVWYSIAFSQDAPLIMLIFPLVHVIVGVGVTYAALAGFYNRTVITVGQGKLSIQHGPIPWPGNKTLQASELTQLYSEERVIRVNNGTQMRYQLSAISRENRKIKLLGGLNAPSEVRFLEHKLEEQLGIQDHPVEGEMPR